MSEKKEGSKKVTVNIPVTLFDELSKRANAKQTNVTEVMKTSLRVGLAITAAVHVGGREAVQSEQFVDALLKALT